ncbi:SixA phosphatase family protein [Jannaschia sp. KMU-145]|uniref:SixA phosphatase family protein n=1 Tax=Jannaschia halovivens TaxID=3388667 RepID=UPI00396B2146
MLILLRHAQAGGGRPDRTRHLTEKGTADARRIGDWLRAEGHLPARILCSPATRTRETLDALDLTAETAFPDDLYNAPTRVLLDHARDATAPLLIVAHNPGIAEAAAELAAPPPDHPAFGHYPPGACCVIGDDGAVLAFVTPKDLA